MLNQTFTEKKTVICGALRYRYYIFFYKKLNYLIHFRRQALVLGLVPCAHFNGYFIYWQVLCAHFDQARVGPKFKKMRNSPLM